MKNSRNKGNNYERTIAREFREILHYEDCVTSRSESKAMDDAGVDLCNTGAFNVQCKAWEHAPSYHDVLARMPQSDSKINVVFHKRNLKGDVVVMRKEDFYRMVIEILMG